MLFLCKRYQFILLYYAPNSCVDKHYSWSKSLKYSLIRSLMLDVAIFCSILKNLNWWIWEKRKIWWLVLKCIQKVVTEEDILWISILKRYHFSKNFIYSGRGECVDPSMIKTWFWFFFRKVKFSERILKWYRYSIFNCFGIYNDWSMWITVKRWQRWSILWKNLPEWEYFPYLFLTRKNSQQNSMLIAKFVSFFPNKENIFQKIISVYRCSLI